jgi:hypothetical protein
MAVQSHFTSFSRAIGQFVTASGHLTSFDHRLIRAIAPAGPPKLNNTRLCGDFCLLGTEMPCGIATDS